VSPSNLDSTLPFEVTSRRSVLFLLLTMPLLFGATHPFILGLYTLFILLGAGGWWIFVGSNPNLKKNRRRRRSSPGAGDQLPVVLPEASGRPGNLWLGAIILLLLYIAFTTMPLPLGLLEWLSPERARNLAAVNNLAAAEIKFAPLSYSGLLTFKQGLFYLSLLLYFFSLKKIVPDEN